MDATAQATIVAALERVSSLNAELRDQIVAGRLDRLGPLLDDREACLQELSQWDLDAVAATEPLHHRIEAVRTEGRELREWLQAEKDEVSTALSSLRSQRVDPFRERLVGATVLDRLA